MSDPSKQRLAKRKRSLSEGLDPQTPKHGRTSPEPSDSPRQVPATSTSSMFDPMNFPKGSVESKSPRQVSTSSTASMFDPMNFSKGSLKSPIPCQVSAESTASMFDPMNFQINPKRLQKTVEVTDHSGISLTSEASMFDPMNFQHEPKRPLDSVCCVCENPCEDSVCLCCGHVACTHCIRSDRDQSETSDQHHCPMCGTYQGVSPKKQALKPETGDRKLSDIIQKHKDEMRNRFLMTGEGNGDEKRPLNDIYTSLSINRKSYVPQNHNSKESLSHQQKKHDFQKQEVDPSDLFEYVPTKLPRTVLTNGVAGIGKSFSVQKFIVDWAEGTANKEVHFVFSLAFRELNLIKNEASFLQLLMNFHPALSDIDPQDLVRTKVIVILDGLDESRFHLDFKNTNRVTSVQKVTTVASLITNLIQGNLLPSAQLWITSRPAASHQIPGEFIHRVTEIQGFNDRQKEEYFTKRFSNKPDVAKLVISHIQSSQTLDPLCQIPIFCWISSVLFEEVSGGEEQTEVPQTLTEMMAAFLFVQTKRSSRKYDKNPEKERIKLLKAKRELLLKLGHLAFLHLLNNSLLFYVEDLQECGLDPTEATVNSGFFNAVLREEELFSQKKVYFFVHLTVQEFFAALYVYDCFTKNKTWAPELSRFLGLDRSDPSSRPCVFELLKMAVDKVLEKNSGHLAFFMRFLLGLVVESNQRFLRGLLVPLDPSQDTVKKMLHHLKTIRRKTISPDACINIFQTMVEMGDTKISEDIQEYLKSEDRARIQLNPLHCSALAFTIQVSKSKLEELDIKSFNTSEEGRRRLIPAVRSSKKVNLADCRVSEVWLKHLSSALTFPHSSLRDLDLSNNDLRDSGVEQLCDGLRNPACKLKILRLSGCLVTEEGCRSLVSALKSNPSHLKELDLSYNHLGAGEAELTALKSDPQYNLSHLELNVFHGGSHRMMPGLRKYVCDLTWEKTHKSLQFSSDHKEVSRTKKGPDRVLVWGERGLSGRCYWEIDATAPFNIGVMYWDSDLKGIEFRLGQNDKSWSFVCSEEGCYVFHNNKSTPVTSSYCSRSSRLAIYLDRPAGVLSFYRVSSDSRTHLHTFKEEFNQDLFPAVELQHKSSAQFWSSPEKSTTVAEGQHST